MGLGGHRLQRLNVTHLMASTQRLGEEVPGGAGRSSLSGSRESSESGKGDV